MMNLRKSFLLGMVTLCFAPLTAQTKMTAEEAAVKIANRILSSTVTTQVYFIRNQKKYLHRLSC